MPLYYDTALPTPSDKNSITRTATDFGLRDFLLHKNIQNPIKYPQLSTSINGSPRGGEPYLDTMVGTGSIIDQVSIEVDGIFRYGNAILMNHYKENDSNSGTLIDIENITRTPIFPTSPIGNGDYTQEDITQYGLLPKSDFKEYRKVATLKNLYVDSTKQIDMADIISLQPQQTSQQITGYLDEYGGLNLGGSASIQAADVIGSVLNGQGLGLAKGGIVTNFDIRASLAGRLLTATGLINDTKLGVIGGQQLALALANNAAFNVEQGLLGKLNVADNILSLFKNGTLAGFRPDYKITVPNSTGGRILDYAERILGFNVPTSFLEDDGSIFFTDNGVTENIKRANSMLDSTGKGQIKALALQFQANLLGISQYDNPNTTPFRSGYSPSYQKGSDGDFIVAGAQPNIYAFYNGGFVKSILTPTDGVIPELSYNKSKLIEAYGFTGPSYDGLAQSAIDVASGFFPPISEDSYGNGISHIKRPTFSWGSTLTGNTVNKSLFTGQITNDKKTLLGKTQKLFNSVGMKNIISVKGDMSIGQGSQIQTSVVKGGISKGSAVMSSGNFNPDGSIKNSTSDSDPNNVFCRSWTTFNRYDTVNKLIRRRGLNQSESDGSPIFSANTKWRLNWQGSVLDDNGFIKIAPYKTDNNGWNATSPKKYMFSIENLAWAGTPANNLPAIERGPGDLLTGVFGRIMWFPPYDLTFSESSSVSLETTNFIGRGEPVYTYNNTERIGNLSFKIIVDHPSIINSFAGTDGPTDEYIRSWFAGCTDLDAKWADKLTIDEKNKQKLNTIKNVPKKTATPIKLPSDFKIFFLNDVTKINVDYENGDGIGFGAYLGEPQTHCTPVGTNNCKTEAGRIFMDNTDYGLNAKALTVVDNSFNGWFTPNYINSLKSFMANDCTSCVAKVIGYASLQGFPDANKALATNRATSVQQWLIDNIGLPANRIVLDTQDSKQLTGTYNPNINTDDIAPKEQRYALVQFTNNAAKMDTGVEVQAQDAAPAANTTLNQTIKRRFYTEASFFDKLGQDSPFIFDKIKEKIKYFHPAFHSITPEGFNSRLTFLLQCTRQGPTIKQAEAKNLAFGPAPVCILRVGDFYNTKIMIDNVSFDFEEQLWDLNPEGIGVQPMIVRVNMSFKYIGGSTLYGPINKLQNALSFNFFANTQVYESRADHIAASTATTTGYALIPGADTTFERIDVLPLQNIDEVTFTNGGKNSDQVATQANNPQPQETPATTGPSNDMSRLIITNITGLFDSEFGNVTFTIARKSKTDFDALSQYYNVTATIINKNNASESYQIKLTQQLTSVDFYQTFFVDFTQTTPVCPGLSASNSYYLNVKFNGVSGSGSGALNNDIV